MLRERADVLPVAVLQIDLDARRDAEPRHLGQVEAERRRVGQREQLAVDARGDRVERVVRRALVPRLHVEKDRRAVRRVRLAEQIQTDQRDDVLHRRLGADDLLDVRDGRLGALQRRRVRELDRQRHVALVFRRDERRRDPRPEQPGERDEHDERADPGRRPAEHRIDRADVAVRRAREHAIEPAEEARRVRLVRFLEQQRAERRRQRERDDARQHDGDHDRHRELLEQRARHAADERHRHEHRAEHEHDRDERARPPAESRGRPRAAAAAPPSP